MCQALLEIMEPEITKIKESVRQATWQATRQATWQEAILIAVKRFRDLGVDNGRIVEILKKDYSLSDEEAEEYLV